MNNNLSQFGNGFQTKTISAILSDIEFLKRIFDILKSDYFDSEADKWIIETILKYHKTYSKCPTLDVFKSEMSDIQSNALKASIVNSLKVCYGHMNSSDLEWIKDEFVNFLRNQEMKNAILQSVDLLEIGKYDKINELIEKAKNSAIPLSTGTLYKETLEERITENVRFPVSTPWEPLNDLMDGGLGSGELGIVIAPSGVGKSWMLIALAANAIKLGKTVVHYTLELYEDYTGLRYDSVFSGIPPQDIKYNKEKVQGVLNKLDGELYIQYYPQNTVGVSTLEAHLNRLASFGVTPDLVICDYGDLLKPSGKQSTDGRYYELGNIYGDLRGLAGKFSIPVWTASQTQRSAVSKEIIESDSIAESYAKIMVADFVMSLSRQINDKINHTGRIHTIKNRFGPDGITFPASISTENGRIVLYKPTSQEGKETSDKMDNDTLKRKLLKSKHEKFNEKTDNF